MLDPCDSVLLYCSIFNYSTNHCHFHLRSPTAPDFPHPLPSQSTPTLPTTSSHSLGSSYRETHSQFGSHPHSSQQGALITKPVHPRLGSDCLSTYSQFDSHPHLATSRPLSTSHTRIVLSPPVTIRLPSTLITTLFTPPV